MTRPAEAFVSTTLFEDGIGYVSVARFRNNGDAEVGVFLLDVYCLGVKDAMYEWLSPAEYEERLLAGLFKVTGKEPLDLPTARKLVEAAAAYAESIGFAPHQDYRKARRVFGGINSAESAATFTFGKDGKPFYIQGPNETPLRRQQILHTLRTRCGEGKYEYLVLAEGDDLPSELRDQLNVEFEDDDDAR
jgi:hypothetical protein